MILVGGMELYVFLQNLNMKRTKILDVTKKNKNHNNANFKPSYVFLPWVLRHCDQLVQLLDKICCREFQLCLCYRKQVIINYNHYSSHFHYPQEHQTVACLNLPTPEPNSRTEQSWSRSTFFDKNSFSSIAPGHTNWPVRSKSAASNNSSQLACDVFFSWINQLFHWEEYTSVLWFTRQL